ncbi:hypothetical protein [Ralstonia syzygii]
MDDWKRVAWLLVGIVIGAGWAYAASWRWQQDIDARRDDAERAGIVVRR